MPDNNAKVGVQLVWENLPDFIKQGQDSVVTALQGVAAPRNPLHPDQRQSGFGLEGTEGNYQLFERTGGSAGSRSEALVPPGVSPGGSGATPGPGSGATTFSIQRVESIQIINAGTVSLTVTGGQAGLAAGAAGVSGAAGAGTTGALSQAEAAQRLMAANPGLPSDTAMTMAGNPSVAAGIVLGGGGGGGIRRDASGRFVGADNTNQDLTAESIRQSAYMQQARSAYTEQALSQPGPMQPFSEWMQNYQAPPPAAPQNFLQRYGRAIGWGAAAGAAVGVGSAMGRNYLAGGDQSPYGLTRDIFGSTIGALPIIGGMLQGIYGPIVDKAEQISNYNQIADWMGVNAGAGGGTLQGVGMGTSPQLLSAATTLARQGIPITQELLDRFNATERVPGGPNNLAASQFRPVIPPAVRGEILEAYQQARTAPTTMAALGFDRAQSLESAANTAFASGNYAAASTLARAVGGEFGRFSVLMRSGARQRLEEQLNAENLETEGVTDEYRAERIGRRGFGRQAEGAEIAATLRFGYARGNVQNLLRQSESDLSQARERGDRATEFAAEARVNALRQQLEQLNAQIDNARFRITEFAFGFPAREAGARANIALSQQGRFISEGQPSATTTPLGIEAVQQLRTRADLLTRQFNADAPSLSGPALVERSAEVERARSEASNASGQIAARPLDVSTRATISGGEFRTQVLESMPGAYGNIRRETLGLMEAYSGASQEIVARRERERRAGILRPEDELHYQEQLQQLSLAQVGAEQRLSFGWQSRLVSQTLGTPRNFALIASQFSLRDAVGAGVANPLFGANAQQLPMWQRFAHEAPFFGMPPGVRGPYPSDDFGALGAPGVGRAGGGMANQPHPATIPPGTIPDARGGYWRHGGPHGGDVYVPPTGGGGGGGGVTGGAGMAGHGPAASFGVYGFPGAHGGPAAGPAVRVSGKVDVTVRLPGGAVVGTGTADLNPAAGDSTPKQNKGPTGSGADDVRNLLAGSGVGFGQNY